MRPRRSSSSLTSNSGAPMRRTHTSALAVRLDMSTSLPLSTRIFVQRESTRPHSTSKKHWRYATSECTPTSEVGVLLAEVSPTHWPAHIRVLHCMRSASSTARFSQVRTTPGPPKGEPPNQLPAGWCSPTQRHRLTSRTESPNGVHRRIAGLSRESRMMRLQRVHKGTRRKCPSSARRYGRFITAYTLL